MFKECFGEVLVVAEGWIVCGESRGLVLGIQCVGICKFLTPSSLPKAHPVQFDGP